MNAIYLDPNQVPATMRSGYNGQKFKAYVVTEATIPASMGLWNGGSRDLYHAIDLTTGQWATVPGQSVAPWDGARRDLTVPLKPGFAIVRHSTLQGKDMGLTFYVHPDNAAKLIPAPMLELSAHEGLVLEATCKFKSSYGGQDRYEMMRRDRRHDDAWPFPSRDQWNDAKQSLISKRLLNKAGAVTPAGRNARNMITEL